ncbi:hypothetical protein [Nonomuraea ceibae]|uniref:hypothetical protein n=1 Tax=Nonomuraea ceibae TaxID=1935170 RepID=UPI001C5D3C2B|nr:hypothetical protein [Nonomuraea ceibae]
MDDDLQRALVFTEMGSILPVERLITRSESIVIALPLIRVYRFACLLQVEVVVNHNAMPDERWDALRSSLFHAPAVPEGSTDGILRFTVNYADGVEISTGQEFEDGEPGLSLAPSGASGTTAATLVQMNLWLQPLPPAKEFALMTEWSASGIRPATIELDGAAIAKAAARSHRY